MASISLCMIAKNEEQFLKQCLESVQGLVDEVILVDTGSTDKTKEIADEFGAKIFDFEWIDDFSAARNESLKHVKGDWILVLDADETISRKDHKNIKKIIEENKFPVASLVQRHYSDDDNRVKFIFSKGDPYLESKRFKGWTSTPVFRLFKNKMGLEFDGVVHETIGPAMQKLGLKFLRTDIPIHHFQYLKPQTEHKEKLKKYLGMLLEKEKRDPANIKNLHDLAITYLQKERNYKKAFEYFKKIHDRDKELLEPYLGMGMILGKAKQYKKAAVLFSAGLQKQTTKTIEISTTSIHIKNTLWYNLALMHIRLGDKEKAKKIFNALLKTPLQRMAKKQLEKL